MHKVSLSVVLALAVGVSTANAATLVDFTGVNSGSGLATGSATIILAPDGTSFAGTISNTSSFDAQITGFGFELANGNLNGFGGTPNPLTSAFGANFDFGDGNLGNVPAGFNSVDLDFGYLTGNNFNGGDPQQGLAPNETLNFVITGAFAGFTETEIAAGLLARFQRVGPNGQGSDVGSVGDVNQTVVPEPASMLLFGTGLAYLARRRLRRDPTTL